jgi:hypothetical protein
MATEIEQVSYTARKALNTNWVAANTMNLTPEITKRPRSGRIGDLITPLLTVGLDEEDPLYETITPTGPGAVWDGTITIESWVNPDRTLDSGASPIGDALASKLARQMMEEAHRILRAEQLNHTDLIVLRPTSRRYSPDTTESPTLERWILVASYSWAEQPA